jgi:TolB-like protein/tetratricopeptide (TPR) repeat protein
VPGQHQIEEISPESVRAQLAKIVASAGFTESLRMARFLTFAVEEALSGNGGRLKEIVIGAEVFDRGVAYDPRIDPIVRVEARRLRAKLREYYDGPGAADAVLLDFPKGRYTPLFRLREPDTRVEPVASDHGAIAVLPFANLGTQPDAVADATPGGAWFSDGMTEELIHALTRIAGLRVVAWNTAALLRDRQDDLSALRTRFGVGHVLRGSVRQSGGRLRVAVHLIDTLTGQYAWSQTYDREMRDVFAIQEEIAASIAATMRLQFSTPAAAASAQGVRSVECYQLCLKGRFHARERTHDGLKRAVACLERAVTIDPASAPAWAALADTWTLFFEYGVEKVADCVPRARHAAARALELDPQLADAWAALGLIYSLYDWRWKESGEAFRRAVELNPGYANARHWYAVDYLALIGKLDEAAAQIEVAMELDPLSSIILEGRAFLKVLARRYDEAIPGYEEIVRNDPAFYKAWTSMGRAYLQKKDYAQAIDRLEKGRALAGPLPTVLGALGEAHARSGNTAEAWRILGQMHDMARVRAVPGTSFAVVHLGLGERDQALSWLERAVDAREAPVASFKVHPIYDELRGDPRFEALMRRIGF